MYSKYLKKRNQLVHIYFWLHQVILKSLVLRCSINVVFFAEINTVIFSFPWLKLTHYFLNYVYNSMKKYSNNHIVLVNKILYLYQNLNSQHWNIQVRLWWLKINISLWATKRKWIRSLELFLMNIHICGLEIWLLWNGGMIYGWMNPLLILYLIIFFHVFLKKWK